MSSRSVVREILTCPEQALQYETLFTVGNGYAGVRGMFEEQESHPYFDSTRIHGLFNSIEGDLSPDLAPAPHWLGLSLEFDGHRFTLDSGVLGYERCRPCHGDADAARAVESPAGDVVRLEFERFASSADQHVLALRVTVTVLKARRMCACAAGSKRASPCRQVQPLEALKRAALRRITCGPIARPRRAAMGWRCPPRWSAT